MEDIIVRVISRIIVPFLQVYGFYVILHGHLSPGGGFPGGAIVGASMILFALSFNLDACSKKISHDTSSLMESGGAIGFVLVGLLAMVLGGEFLANKAAGFPMGVAGDLFSAGFIPVVTVAIGFKVASTVLTLFYNLVGEDEADGGSH